MKHQQQQHKRHGDREWKRKMTTMTANNQTELLDKIVMKALKQRRLALIFTRQNKTKTATNHESVEGMHAMRGLVEQTLA